MVSYADKLRDPRWQRARLEVFGRDGWACRRCGETAKTLHVHHREYVGADPWDTPPALLETLCEDCHGQSHAPRPLDPATLAEWRSSVEHRLGLAVAAVRKVLEEIGQLEAEAVAVQAAGSRE